MVSSVLVLRRSPANPNHHLWNNHGTWFVHYVVHYANGTRERFRDSLETKSLAEARQRRDRFLSARAASASTPYVP